MLRKLLAGFMVVALAVGLAVGLAPGAEASGVTTHSWMATEAIALVDVFVAPISAQREPCASPHFAGQADVYVYRRRQGPVCEPLGREDVVGPGKILEFQHSAPRTSDGRPNRVPGVARSAR